VLAYLRSLEGEEAERGRIIADIQAGFVQDHKDPPGIRTIDKALRDLSDGGAVERTTRGTYRIAS